MATGFELAERGRRARDEGRPQEAYDCYQAAAYVFEATRNGARAAEAQQAADELREEHDLS